MVKSIILPLLFFVVGFSGHADESLGKYRWKSRIILHNGLTEIDRNAIEASADGIADRDLIFIKTNAELARKFQIARNSRTYLLIGKDGGEKARQTKQLNLPAFYRLIDQMPMRRREMRDKMRK